MPMIELEGSLQYLGGELLASMDGGISIYGVVGNRLIVSSSIYNAAVFTGTGLATTASGSAALEGTVTMVEFQPVDRDVLNGGGGIVFLHPLTISDISYPAASLFDVVERTATGIVAAFDAAGFVRWLGARDWQIVGSDQADIAAPGAVFALEGDDTIRLGAGDDIGGGGAGSDRIYGEAGNDMLAGGNGLDRLEGGDGDDRLEGGDQGDVLSGDAGDDTLWGDNGADRLVGGTGNDEMHGGLSADRLLGLDGDDAMWGDWGDDTLRGGSGNDAGDGGAGLDVVLGGTGRDTLTGGGDDDIVRGNGGFDTVDGGDGDDLVAGGAQADLVLGGAGDDTVQGGGGFDTVDGGTGDDEMTGNFNADTFLFSDGHGADTITDFEATNNAEKIDLSGISAIASLADLDLGSASLGAATQVGADVVIDTGGGNSITLTGVSLSDLDASDFIF
ncbi:MAG: calcium-binding protein [Paracoccaceae bacterium]